MSTFDTRRRQTFLTERFFAAQILRRDRMTPALKAELALPKTDAEGASLLTASVVDNIYEHLVLEYTAGNPIEALRAPLAQVITACEHHQLALARYEQIPQVSRWASTNSATTSAACNSWGCASCCTGPIS